jgi:hypothetical protein
LYVPLTGGSPEKLRKVGGVFPMISRSESGLSAKPPTPAPPVPSSLTCIRQHRPAGKIAR